MRFVRFCLPGLLLGVAWSGIATVAQTATAPSSARAANSASENADHDLEVLPLWPGKPPGTDNWNAREKVFVSKDGTRFIQNVTLPTLTVFPPQGKANGTAVVICPGGAYHFLAIDYEGNDVARWLSSLGVTAFVLKYRVYPTGEDPLNEVHALMAGKPEFREHLRIAMPVADEDGRQAVRIVRQRAGKWGIDPNRIMLMGFSAGGGLTVDVALKHRR
jgi:acetyl esterase/lipase